nr:MAG: minor capsid protein 2 [Bacteriophage sp.]
MPNPKKITMPDNVRNQLIIQLRGFDARHYANTERYARQIDRVYKTACDEYARLGASLDAPEGEAVFSFDKYPRARKQAQGIMQRLAKKVESVITSGTQSEWLAATYKNDAFLGSILRTSKLTKEELEQYQGRNLEALNTFQRRKVEGMGLSERVWKQAEDMKAAIELGIDVAIGDGRDAQQLSRDLRSYLQEPKRLYRRVRDKGGVLRLSKAAKMYHPGQGVYRSSAKNAQRLARTEINMAYRESEFLRWQKLDFVVGLRICLSNNHTIMNSKGEPVPLVDICDELWGDYPKTFKFVGWHPQCRCYVVPILSDYDEYNQDRANRLKAIVRGTAYKSLPSRRSVVDVPRKFREYIDSILERSKSWKSQPYYIRDNFVGGKIEGGLNPVIPTKTMNTVQPCTEFDGRIAMLKRWAYAFGLDLSNFESLRTAGNRAALLAEVERLDELGTKRQSAWQDAYTELYYFAQNEAKGNKEITDICEKELRDNAITTSHYYGDCTSKLKAAFSAVVAKLAAVVNASGDKPHPALKKKYTTEAEVDATFKKINAGLKEKWFENGDLQLMEETNPGNNGSTWMDGRLYLTKDRLGYVKAALGKIGSKRSADITDDEADGMATFWHEITHNRNKRGNMVLTDTQRSYMELANEFVARKTLPEFYKTLGCKETPHPQYITNRNSTGYNRMVNNYDFVIQRLGLDADKVLAAVRKNLYNEVYSDQQTGLRQGLIDGGIKRADGSKVKISELNKILKYCKDTGQGTLENWLKSNGFIAKEK